MDPELSAWYDERLDAMKRESWWMAVVVLLGAALVFALVMGFWTALQDPKNRVVALVFVGLGAAYFIVRFAIVEFARYRLKLEFAKRAMLR